MHTCWVFPGVSTQDLNAEKHGFRGLKVLSNVSSGVLKQLTMGTVQHSWGVFLASFVAIEVNILLVTYLYAFIQGTYLPFCCIFKALE